MSSSRRAPLECFRSRIEMEWVSRKNIGFLGDNDGQRCLTIPSRKLRAEISNFSMVKAGISHGHGCASNAVFRQTRTMHFPVSCSSVSVVSHSRNFQSREFRSGADRPFWISIVDIPDIEMECMFKSHSDRTLVTISAYEQIRNAEPGPIFDGPFSEVGFHRCDLGSVGCQHLLCCVRYDSSSSQF
jgi:hypothetical protein